ncbi:hypothetical protein ACA910_019917 [Epithemia clementina (nom. ined.)]
MAACNYEEDNNSNSNSESEVVLFEVEERDFVEILLPTNSDKNNTVGNGVVAETRTARPIQGDCGNSISTKLVLGQYNSHHKDWGIHSTVWEGGLALLCYLIDRWRNHQATAISPLSFDVLLDLGSGTGLVGLGMAAATAAKTSAMSQQPVVAVTDLAIALPLLHDNIKRNGHLFAAPKPYYDGSLTQTPQAHVLDWANPEAALTSWIPQFCCQPAPPFKLEQQKDASCAKRNRRKRILVTGADIVYRPSLFEPLLSTLDELWSFFSPCETKTPKKEEDASTSNAPHLKSADVSTSSAYSLECILACQSIRSHLTTFWDAANQHGFNVHQLATVELDCDGHNPNNKLDLDRATIHHNKLSTAPDDTVLTPREGRILIVRLRKQKQSDC